MPTSHHSHSGQFCKHASGLLEEVVAQAINKGFKSYGLTEHVPRFRTEDLYPEEAALSLEDLDAQFRGFLVEAHRLKSLYAPQISILVGLETENITSLDLMGLKDLLESHKDSVDYIVGSLHHVNEIPIDFDFPTFKKALASVDKGSEHDLQQDFYCRYFDSQHEVLQQFKPEIVGHFDLCRLYTPSIRFEDYPRAWKAMERNIDFAIQYGALFEINSAAFNKGWTTAYPSDDVLKRILEKGGRLALSDDSHGPSSVGLNYDRTKTYLQAVGLKELWYLTGSEVPNAGGRMVRATKIPGEWWTHEFWLKNYPES